MTMPTFVLGWFGAGLFLSPLVYLVWLRHWDREALLGHRRNKSDALIMAVSGLLMGPTAVVVAIVLAREHR